MTRLIISFYLCAAAFWCLCPREVCRIPIHATVPSDRNIATSNFDAKLRHVSRPQWTGKAAVGRDMKIMTLQRIFYCPGWGTPKFVPADDISGPICPSMRGPCSMFCHQLTGKKHFAPTKKFDGTKWSKWIECKRRRCRSKLRNFARRLHDLLKQDQRL